MHKKEYPITSKSSSYISKNVIQKSIAMKNLGYIHSMSPRFFDHAF